MSAPDGSEGSAVVLSTASRALRRRLRPVVWVTLEEVALDAVLEDGRLVARTSARQVAERLGLDPGTAAGALRDLRRRGLLVLEREHDRAGRFDLSVYVLGSIAGLRVLSPCVDSPCADPPYMENPPKGRLPSTDAEIAPLYALRSGTMASMGARYLRLQGLDLGLASS